MTLENKTNYESHVKNKNQARSLKEKDKRDAQNDAKIFCATFDMQKVLLSPSGEISLFYYSKRLKVHNLSVFDIGNLIGTCYIWNEQIANKGSNEIASCIYDIIKLKTEQDCDDFRFWSDNCTGQNRSRIMFFLCIYIERASKGINIYTASEWISLI